MIRYFLFVAALFWSEQVQADYDPVSDKIVQTVKQFGHIAIAIPAKKYLPGSYVYRSNYIENSELDHGVSLGFLCSPKYSTYKISVKPDEDEVGLVGLFGPRPYLELKREHLERLGLANIAEYAKVTSVRIVDQKVVSFPQNVLSQIHAKLGDVCRDTIRNNISKWGEAYQVVSVHEFKLNYSISFHYALREDIKRKMNKELQSLTGGRPSQREESSGNITFSGAVRVYGIDLKDVSKLNF